MTLEFGIRPSELPELRIGFLLSLAEDAAGGRDATKTNTGYKAQFFWIWKARFKHLSPEARRLALIAEWARRERKQPHHWKGES